MRAQAGKTGKGKGGRTMSEIPARISKAPAKKKPVGGFTYTGPRKATKKK